jgi:hypothetical protein
MLIRKKLFELLRRNGEEEVHGASPTAVARERATRFSSACR